MTDLHGYPLNNRPSEAEKLTEHGGLLSHEYLERLARSVFITSRIPEGSDYVGIIGDGNGGTNREAVYTLLVKHVDQLSEIPESQRLEKGIEILLNRFRDVEILFNI